MDKSIGSTRPHILPPLKPGEPVPAGYIAVPILAQHAYFDFTPKAHRDHGGGRIVRLAELKENRSCKSADFFLAGGKKCCLIFPNGEHVFDEALKHLPSKDRAALRKHVLPTLQPK